MNHKSISDSIYVQKITKIDGVCMFNLHFNDFCFFFLSVLVAIAKNQKSKNKLNTVFAKIWNKIIGIIKSNERKLICLYLTERSKMISKVEQCKIEKKKPKNRKNSFSLIAFNNSKMNQEHQHEKETQKKLAILFSIIRLSDTFFLQCITSC